MASERNERNDNKRGGTRRETNNGGSSSGGGGGSVPRGQETAVRALFVLDEILKSTDPIDAELSVPAAAAAPARSG